MLFRAFILLIAVFTVSACVSTSGDTDVGDVRIIEDREDITAGSLDNGMYVEDIGTDIAGPPQGTQQDLVVNVGDRVFFGYDRYNLTPEAQRTIALQAEWMKRYPGVTVAIEGHCDERGTREYNLALGERRASAVKSYLIALGISPTRIETISFGKERPAVVGTGETIWSQNRRSVAIVN